MTNQSVLVHKVCVVVSSFFRQLWRIECMWEMQVFDFPKPRHKIVNVKIRRNSVHLVPEKHKKCACCYYFGGANFNNN